MEHTIIKTESAYEYPLLIKQLYLAPAEYRPDEKIIYRDEAEFTYAEWRERVCRLAGALESIGVERGSTVAVLDYDSHRYLEAYYGIPMMGAVIHMINMRLSPEQLAYTIEHAEDDVIICHKDFLPLLEAIKGRIAEGRKFIIIGESEGSASLDIVGEYEEMLAAAAPSYDFPEFDENTRATTFYTTGTTGLPKGVYFSHRQIVLHTLINTISLTANAEQGRLHKESVYMPLTPMFHVHAWGIPYIANYLGVKHVYPGKYEPPMLLKLLLTHRVSYSHCVPTILHMLLASPAAADFDLSFWTVVIGGAALPKATAAAALKRGIDVYAGYGMSETAPVLSVSTLTRAELELDDETQINLRTRTGRPVGMSQIRVIDQDGNDVPKDDATPGEIIVRNPYLTMGYHKDHVHSEKLWEGGWLHTNDVACVDAAGSLRIVDRTKDVIKVGGEWVGSLEIEDVITKHEQVTETAVIAYPDEQWGEVPLAIVVPAEGAELTERNIKSFVMASVEEGVLPREAITIKVRFTDMIDKTSVGKINKVALRKRFLEN